MITSTTATEPLLFEVLDEDEGKTKSRLSYAYFSLGDARFSVSHAARERAAVDESIFVPGGGANASFGRSVQPGFVAQAT